MRKTRREARMEKGVRKKGMGKLRREEDGKEETRWRMGEEEWEEWKREGRKQRGGRERGNAL